MSKSLLERSVACTPPARARRRAQLAAIGVCLFLPGLLACSGDESAASGRAKAIPIPVPFPLTFPIPTAVPNLDQLGAYDNTRFGLAYVSAFTILARDKATGDLGIATVSNMPAIGAVLPAAKAGAGAIMVGALPNTSWKSRGLELLAQGKSAEEVIDLLVTARETEDKKRQFAVLDSEGRSAFHIGRDVAGQDERTSCRTRPNCLAIVCEIAPFHETPTAMLDSFEKTEGLALPERLLLALQAGWDCSVAGAPPQPDLQFAARPAASAALLVVREGGGYDERSDRLVDLRIDLSKNPLPRLVEAYYAWCSGVIVPRSKALLGRIDPDDPAHEINRRWLRRARLRKLK